MKNIFNLNALFLVAIFLNGCSSIKVLDAWKSSEIHSIKEQNVLVIARTQNDDARRAFERDLADQLINRGINAVPSFSKFPPLLKSEEMTEEHMQIIKEILDNEGFDAVVLTSIKDVRERTVTSGGSYYYFNDPWSFYYPSYFGSFSGYYYQPYYVYNFRTPSTYTSKTFYLESVAYNLKAAEGEQLLAVVTTSIKDPKEAYKISEKLSEEILKALEK
jgi:hypothetical protein